MLKRSIVGFLETGVFYFDELFELLSVAASLSSTFISEHSFLNVRLQSLLDVFGDNPGSRDTLETWRFESSYSLLRGWIGLIPSSSSISSI